MPSTSLPFSNGDSQLQALADEVRAELAAAGLPILPADHDLQAEQTSGVSIEIDEESLWVSWKIHSALSEASQRAFRVGAWRPDNPDGFDGHPAMRHSGALVRQPPFEILLLNRPSAPRNEPKACRVRRNGSRRTDPVQENRRTRSARMLPGGSLRPG
jgi:hypothetical protein